MVWRFYRHKMRSNKIQVRNIQLALGYWWPKTHGGDKEVKWGVGDLARLGEFEVETTKVKRHWLHQEDIKTKFFYTWANKTTKKITIKTKQRVAKEMTRKLEMNFLVEKVEIALRHISSHKSPSLYGVGAGFYQNYWKIVRENWVSVCAIPL